MSAFDDRATEADILACFRLLLGRAPNPEEWAGHSARAGEALGPVVSGYVNSLEFHRRRLQDPAAGVAPQVAELYGVRILASADDLAVGCQVLNGAYEPEVVAVFESLLRPGMHVVDVGANIGVFTMLAGRLVGPEGSVLAVEPNPRNARMVEASRRLNGFAHVTVLQAAAGRGVGLLELNTSFSNGTTSAIDDRDVLRAESVACVALDPLLDPARPVGLIKLDVEGAEFNALAGCEAMLRRDRPAIVLEFGPGALPSISGVSGEELLGWLIERGYELDVLRADGAPVAAGRDVGAVMAAFVARGADHIDLLARPVARPNGVLGRLFGRA